MQYQLYQPYRALAVRNANKVAALENFSNGRQIYIIGSGPSIKNTDLSRLDGQIVIFLNNAVNLINKFSPSKSFLMISDHLRVIELRNSFEAKSISCIATTDKILNPAISSLIYSEPIIFVMPKLLSKPNGDLQISSEFGFSDSPKQGLYLGKSIVFPAIQMAWYMGATTISLVGVDMTIGAGATYFDQTIKSNWSAFQYSRDGRPHFAIMRDYLSERGCVLQNLTVGGMLDVLPHDPTRLAVEVPAYATGVAPK